MLEMIMAWASTILAALVITPVFAYLITKAATVAFFSSKLQYELEAQQRLARKTKM